VDPSRGGAPRTALFADHEEIQAIARQMTRTKGELDRSVLALRGQPRNLGRHLTDAASLPANVRICTRWARQSADS
jgi:hypothetical protein